MKVRRAKKHIDKLASCLDEFMAREPYDALVEPNPEGGETGKRWRAIVREDPPDDLALIAGDAIHNLRSSLDLLVRQLILANGKDPKREAFPIGDSKTDFETGRLGIKTLKGRISKDALGVVRELQPYKGGDDTLWQLHKLDIVDKHRVLLVVGAAFEHLLMSFTPPGWSEATTIPLNPSTRGFPLKDGDVLPMAVSDQATYTSVPGGPEPEIDTKPSFAVAINEPGVVEAEPIVAFLNGLTSKVEGTLGAFALLL